MNVDIEIPTETYVLSTKSEPLTIDGKILIVDNITISEKVSAFLTKYYKVDSSKKTNQLLRENLKYGEYLGICIINKFSSSGHLIKTSDNLFVVLSLDLLKFVYSSYTLTAFHILEDPSSYFVVVNGKEYDVSDIELSHHFSKQATERFKIPMDSVKSLFFDIVVKGRYICVTHCREDHNPAHLFCKDGKLVYVSLDLKTAITTYSNPMITSSTHQNIKEKIESLLISEIKKLAKQEVKLNSKKTKERLLFNLKVAEIELEIYNSKSKNFIDVLQNDLKNLKEEMDLLEDTWNEVVDEIRRHAITLSAFV